MKAQVSQFTVKATVVAVDEIANGFKRVELEDGAGKMHHTTTKLDVHVGEEAAIEIVTVEVPLFKVKS